MRRSERRTIVGAVTSFAAVILTTAVMLTAAAACAAAEATPPVSEFAPAEDLAAQVTYYIEQLDKSLSSEEEYTEAEIKRVKRYANTLAVISLALGLHDKDHKLKKSAPALVAVAGKLAAAAADRAAAKGHLAAIKKAAAGEVTGGGPLKWEKVADLPLLMKQVPVINSRLRRGVRSSKFKRDKAKTIGYSAALAAIAQASIVDLSAVKKKEDAEKWPKFCIQMRDAAGALNKAIHAQDADAAKKATLALKKSCEDCHDVFREEEK